MYLENALNFVGGISIESAAGPSAVNIAPGYINWSQGRRGMRLQLTYANGWAHAGIVSSAALGATQLQVDDCTGMVISTQGRGMWIYDGANTEHIIVISTSATYGPGTVTLKSPLLYSHNGTTQQPIIISSLPAAVQQAAILHASYQALTRGATATTVQNMPGSNSNQSGGGQQMMNDVKEMLKPYRRVL
jgi:hypothetical protein